MYINKSSVLNLLKIFQSKTLRIDHFCKHYIVKIAMNMTFSNVIIKVIYIFQNVISLFFLFITFYKQEYSHSINYSMSAQVFKIEL